MASIVLNFSIESENFEQNSTSHFATTPYTKNHRSVCRAESRFELKVLDQARSKPSSRRSNSDGHVFERHLVVTVDLANRYYLFRKPKIPIYQR